MRKKKYFFLAATCFGYFFAIQPESQALAPTTFINEDIFDEGMALGAKKTTEELTAPTTFIKEDIFDEEMALGAKKPTEELTFRPVISSEDKENIAQNNLTSQAMPAARKLSLREAPTVRRIVDWPFNIPASSSGRMSNRKLSLLHPDSQTSPFRKVFSRENIDIHLQLNGQPEFEQLTFRIHSGSFEELKEFFSSSGSDQSFAIELKGYRITTAEDFKSLFEESISPFMHGDTIAVWINPYPQGASIEHCFKNIRSA